LIRKKPKQLKKVPRILKVATMWKVNEQNSLPIHSTRPQTATFCIWNAADSKEKLVCVGLL
jgi:hypothetical protein